MKYEIRPFVMLNDIEGIYEFANDNPSPVPFSVDTIRIGYPIVDYGKESYHDFPTSDGKPIEGEEKVLAMQRRKRAVIDATVASTDTAALASLTEGDVRSLFEL